MLFANRSPAGTVLEYCYIQSWCASQMNDRMQHLLIIIVYICDILVQNYIKHV